jgi:hypothetical protein
MTKKIRYWCDSGANIHSKYEDETTLEELGLSEAEWLALTETQRDEIMKEYAFGRLDWGYRLEDA